MTAANASHRLTLIALATALLPAFVPAQLPAQPGTNLFGDELVRKLPSAAASGTAVATDPAPAPDGYPHTVIFQNGGQLRGEIVSLGNEEILWRRPDAGESLHFSRAEVRRIVLNEGEASAIPPQGNAIRATVRFAGGDWLYGDLRSSDGESFSLKTAAGAEFTFPRSRIRSVKFDRQPEPVAGFFGQALDLDEWRSEGGPIEPSTQDGRITLHGVSSISHALPPMNQFEASIEFPPGYESSTLSFATAAPKADSFSPSALTLVFERKRILVTLAGGALRKQAPVPVTVDSANSPISYRIVFDGPAQRVRVSRNGAKVVDWSFGLDPGDKVNRWDPDYDDGAPDPSTDREGWERAKASERTNETVRAVYLGRTFRRQEGFGDGESRISSLTIESWNGRWPENGVEAEGAGAFSNGDVNAQRGVLKSISENELGYSRGVVPIQAGTRLEFGDSEGVPVETDGWLYFGDEGRIGIRELQIGKDGVNCRPAFGAALSLPFAALHMAVFPARKAPPPGPDLLVFKDGEVLGGSLVGAASDEALRWRLANGKDVEISPRNVAGLRFRIDEDHAPNEPGAAILELRNGDRLCGKLISVDEGRFEFQDPQAGTYSIPMRNLWKLVPTVEKGWSDGALNSEAWLSVASPGGPDLFGVASWFKPNSWTYLDGAYVLSGPAEKSFAAIRAPVGRPSDRFQISFDATNLSGGPPQFGFRIGEDTDPASVRIDYRGDTAQLSESYLSPKGGGGFSRGLKLSDERKERFSRMEVCAFVDTKIGNVDLYFDGSFVARVGSTPKCQIADLGNSITLYAENRGGELPMVLSAIAVRPWIGELPEPHEKTRLLLTNRDAVDGELRGLRDGKLAIEGEVGLLDFPLTQVREVEFGGIAAPEKAAARLRFANGAIIHVQSFRLGATELVAHSAVLGDIRVSGDALTEVILDPAPLPFASPIAKKPPRNSKAAATAESPAQF